MLAQCYPYSPGTKPRVAPFGSRWNHISKRDPEPQDSEEEHRCQNVR